MRRTLLLAAIMLVACSEPTGPTLKRQTLPVAAALTNVQASQADALINSMSVQTHLGYGGGVYDTAWTTIKTRLGELGIRHIRERMFNDSTTIQRTRSLYTDLGITLTAGCWPRQTGSTFDLSSAAHCITQANAYGPMIDAFDGWNEVDGQPGWSSNWYAWQSVMYPALKGNPTWGTRPVLGNSLASASSADAVGNRASVVDKGNLHSYPGGQNGPVANLITTWVPQWNKIDGGKPDWATETGYHSCTTCTNGVGVTEAAQGKYVNRLFVEYFVRGIERTNWYELINQGVSTTDREKNWGLLRNDGSPKPSFNAVKNMITLLEDPGAPFSPGTLSYQITGALSTTKSALFQKRNGKFYIVLWQDVKSYDSGTKKDLNPAADDVTVTLGTSKPWKTYRPYVSTAVRGSGTGTSISVAVPDHLLIIEIG